MVHSIPLTVLMKRKEWNGTEQNRNVERVLGDLVQPAQAGDLIIFRTITFHSKKNKAFRDSGFNCHTKKHE